MKPARYFAFLVIISGLITKTGCSQQNPNPALTPKDRQQTKRPETNPAPGLVFPILSQPPPAPRNGYESNKLSLEYDTSVSELSILLANDLVGQNPAARDKLLKANGAKEPIVMSRADKDEIILELSKIEGFKFENPGTVTFFDRFTLVNVGGYIGTDYYRAFLIRIPGNSWSLLGLRLYPAPLRTQ
jgi:hypothetical protein